MKSYLIVILIAACSMALMITVDILPYKIPHARYLSAIKEFDPYAAEYEQYSAKNDTVKIYLHPKETAELLAKCNEFMVMYKIGEHKSYYKIKIYFWMKTRYLDFTDKKTVLSNKSDKMRIGWSGSLKLGFVFRNAEFKIIEFDEQKKWVLGELTGWVKKENVKMEIQ